jgi:hypothetical protein
MGLVLSQASALSCHRQGIKVHHVMKSRFQRHDLMAILDGIADAIVKLGSSSELCRDESSCSRDVLAARTRSGEQQAASSLFLPL